MMVRTSMSITDLITISPMKKLLWSTILFLSTASICFAGNTTYLPSFAQKYKIKESLASYVFNAKEMIATQTLSLNLQAVTNGGVTYLPLVSFLPVLYPMMGSTAPASTQNLMGSSYTASEHGPVTHSTAAGVVFENTGTSFGYWDSLYNPSVTGVSNLGIGMWFTNTHAGSTSGADAGGSNGAGTNTIIENPSNSGGTQYGANGGNTLTVGGPFTGLYVANRNGTTVAAYNNGSSVGSNTGTAALRGNVNEFFGAESSAGTPFPDGYNDDVTAALIISAGLSAPQETSLYKALHSFENVLGR